MTIEETLQAMLAELRAISKALNGNKFSPPEEIGCPKLIPYTKWSKYQKVPSQGTIKSLLLNRKDNGFDKCVSRISGRLYIDRDLFHQWVQEQNEWKNNPDYIKKNLLRF